MEGQCERYERTWEESRILKLVVARWYIVRLDFIAVRNIVLHTNAYVLYILSLLVTPV